MVKFQLLRQTLLHNLVPLGYILSSRIPHGLLHAYRLLGYEPALTLARKIITYLRRYFYTEKGEFLRTPDDCLMAHFHRHANGLLVMAEYAKTVDDEELMEFVVRSFQYAESLGCSLGGPGYAEVEVPRANPIGYFPEYVNSPEWEGKSSRKDLGSLRRLASCQ